MAKDIKVAPDELVYSQGGKLFLKETPKEGPQGPYDQIFACGNQSHLVGEVPPEDRLDSRFPDTSVWRIIGHNHDGVSYHMHSVSEIVNDPTRSADKPEDRFLYQKEIMPVFQRGAEELKKVLEERGVLEDGNFIILSPLNGGKFAASALRYKAAQMGWDIPEDRFACFELKRVLMESGDLFIGANTYYMPEANENTVVVVCDDCVASDKSTSVSIILGKEGTDNSERPVVMVAAASQVGMEGLYREHGAMTITGVPVYKLNEDLYLMRTQSEGYSKDSFFVGDMGKWLGSLPEELDSPAPWNKARRELVDYWNSVAPEAEISY